MINVHASLLPKYRGAAPIHRAVMAGETETGITIIKLVREMDAGPMLRASPVPIAVDQTSAGLETELATLGAELALASLDDIDSGRAVFVEQDHEQATFAPRITRADGLIDWHRAAAAIHDQVRGLHPWPHAYTFLAGRRLLIRRSSVTTRPEGGDPDAPVDGEVLAAAKDRLVVATGAGGALALHEIQPEGRRPVETRAFLAGHALAPGAVFRVSADATA